MWYYEVLVGAMAYHGQSALTYLSEQQLQSGQVVRIALRSRSTLGIVLREVPKPDFDLKPIAAIAPFPAIPTENLQLMHWLQAYYPAPLGAVARLFVPPTELFPKDLSVPHFQPYNTANLSALSPDQTHALATINGPGTFLLHGITGSGKSRVYIELCVRAISKGTSAIVLTPEIGLTAQLTKTFQEVFGERVFVLHSQLTARQRRTIWYQLLAATEPVIVIGPRSALFSPVHNLGLIVLDESHDNAYKNESTPHYQATRVAAKLAQLHNASLVLGSATPATQDYYLAHERNRPIVEMHQLAKQSAHKVTIEMIDMRNRELFSRNSLLSDTLLSRITNSMKRGEQSLLYLNRRGTANVVLCNNCGWQSVCPNCDLSLTYHGDEHELRCHVCGHKTVAPTSCPVCQNTDILFKSIGTKAVVAALQKLFPAARLQRFDTDAKKSERLEQHLDSLIAGGSDIIVGTQMVGKGLDLPKLSVVGIINADSSLLIPDYTATEQTYQLITQVVGRVGRGHRQSTVVVQSYDPENATLRAAVHQDWSSFYETELAERRMFHFPPFTHLLKLRCLRATSTGAEKAAIALAAQISKHYIQLIVDGPVPSFHPKERGKYSWQLLIKSPTRQTLVEIIQNLPSGWSYDIDPVNLL
jgi:primosomal protein N' (replication factor Y) (superfamily II helicase)